MDWARFFPHDPRTDPCPSCGIVHPRCRSHDVDGDPCGKKVVGFRYCADHLPLENALQTKKPVVRQAFVEGQIGKLLKECDIPSQHPLDGLLEVVRHAGAMFRLLGGLVGELDIMPGSNLVGMDSSGQPVYHNKGFTGPNHMGDEVPAALVSLYGLWSDRYARACKLALDANIDERLVRNAEQTSSVLFDAIGRALRTADLSPTQLDALKRSLAVELRKVVGPSGDLVPAASRAAQPGLAAD